MLNACHKKHGLPVTHIILMFNTCHKKQGLPWTHIILMLNTCHKKQGLPWTHIILMLNTCHNEQGQCWTHTIPKFKKTLVTMNRVYPEHTQTAQLVGHLDNQTTGVDRHWHSPPNPQTNSTTSWAPWQSAPCSRPSDHLAQSPPPPPPKKNKKPHKQQHQLGTMTNRNLESTITWHSPPNPSIRPLESTI